MELRHLHYFIAVAEELHFTRAAERLYISQPPLSRQIRDLEKELGVVLLERNPKGVQLTPAGKTFLEEARAIINRVDEAKSRIRGKTTRRKNKIRVGYWPTQITEILSPVLHAFERANRGIQVELVEQQTARLLTALKDSKIDLAVVVKPRIKAGSELSFELLSETPSGLIVPPRHKFARRRSVSMEEALGEPVVPYARNANKDYHHWLTTVCKRAGIKPRLAAEVAGPMELFVAIQKGRGVSFGTRTFASAAGGTVKYVPVSPDPPMLQIGYVTRTDMQSAAVNRFIKALKSATRRLTKSGAKARAI